MKILKIIFAIFLFSLFVYAFFTAGDSNSQIRKIYRSIKVLKNDYAPIYSQKYLNEKVFETKKNLKKEAFATFKDFIYMDSLDISLDKAKEVKVRNLDNGESIEITSYETNFLNLVKRFPEIGPAYLDTYNDDLIIAQENGLFFSAPKNQLNKNFNSVEVKEIRSNIYKFTQYFDFFGQGQFGIKDILVLDNMIYVSYINQVEDDCFNMSILSAKMSDYLQFSKFFSPKQCVKNRWKSINDNVYTANDNKEFNAHQSGGRIVEYHKGKLLFSTGDFRQRELAQDTESYLGKILAIDIKTGDFKIISSGLRNPQGLYFSNKHGEIWETEHGPNGGDEINLQKTIDPENVQNFGWPISSYGVHYGYGGYKQKNNTFYLEENRKAEIYKQFPLHKSHLDHGFNEPFFQFSPSVGISQIIEYPLTHLSTENIRIFIFGTMGYRTNNTSKDLSLYFLTVNKKDEILQLEQFEIDGRVRDLIIDKKTNQIYFSDDLNGKIGLINIKKEFN